MFAYYAPTKTIKELDASGASYVQTTVLDVGAVTSGNFNPDAFIGLAFVDRDSMGAIYVQRDDNIGFVGVWNPMTPTVWAAYGNPSMAKNDVFWIHNAGWEAGVYYWQFCVSGRKFSG